jgi:hypothetical protein
MRPRSLTGPLILVIIGGLFLWRNLPSGSAHLRDHGPLLAVPADPLGRAAADRSRLARLELEERFQRRRGGAGGAGLPGRLRNVGRLPPWHPIGTGRASTPSATSTIIAVSAKAPAAGDEAHRLRYRARQYQSDRRRYARGRGERQQGDPQFLAGGCRPRQ